MDDKPVRSGLIREVSDTASSIVMIVIGMGLAVLAMYYMAVAITTLWQDRDFIGAAMPIMAAVGCAFACRALIETAHNWSSYGFFAKHNTDDEEDGEDDN